MEYSTLYGNDNGTIKVRMTINGHILEQDFDATNLDDNVKQGMAVFKSELDRNITTTPDVIPETVTVDSLPDIEE